jgi:hypothetical protein
MNTLRFTSKQQMILSALIGWGVQTAAMAATPGVPTTCVVTRDQVIAELKAGTSPELIGVKYANCQAADYVAPSANQLQPPAPWSTRYEDIRGCGYQPQRKEAACQVNITQLAGYNGVYPSGSFEFVKFCVDYGAGWVPVNTNGFHVNDANAVSGMPVWNFSAIISANQTLFEQRSSGQLLRAKAILSWGAPPGGTCAAPTLVWGGETYFRIRLDP